MHSSCLIHALATKSGEGRGRRLRLIQEALSADEVTHLTSLVGRLGVASVQAELNGRLHLRDFFRRDPMFMDLLDWPTTFPKVWESAAGIRTVVA